MVGLAPDLHQKIDTACAEIVHLNEGDRIGLSRRIAHDGVADPMFCTRKNDAVSHTEGSPWEAGPVGRIILDRAAPNLGVGNHHPQITDIRKLHEIQGDVFDSAHHIFDFDEVTNFQKANLDDQNSKREI